MTRSNGRRLVVVAVADCNSERMDDSVLDNIMSSASYIDKRAHTIIYVESRDAVRAYPSFTLATSCQKFAHIAMYKHQFAM
eukprot:scaffold350938_cov24-Prasinocladus_malaysianus.AAC.1